MRGLNITAVFSGLLLCSHCAWAAQARTSIEGTTPDSKVKGLLILTEAEEGVMVEGNFMNLPPGKHGFHIHENGSCADEGKAAGGHFNPDKVQHGYMPKDGMTHAHPGDMGNVEADGEGRANVHVFLKGTSLKEGKYAVLGKSVIVHEKIDDFSQPTGNAGGRIGCGIIEENKS